MDERSPYRPVRSRQLRDVTRATGSLLRAGLPLGIGLAAFVPACGTTAPTEVVVEVYTDLPCPAVAAVAAGEAGALGNRDPSAVSTVCDPETGSLGQLVIVPREDSSAELAVEVRVRTDHRSPEACVESKNYSGCIVARRILNYIPGRSVRLRVDLRDPCVDVPCSQTTSCVAQGVGQACVEARIDPTKCAGVCTDEDLVSQDEGGFASCGGDDDRCGDGATCVLVGDEARCLCPSGYTLDAETQDCVDVDECTEELHDCDEHAFCENTPGGFDCTCDEGYSGDGTACSDVNECTAGTHDCVSPATCVNESGSFSCECPGHLVLEGTNTCVCPGDGVHCGGACIDPSTDLQYCGASGTCEGSSAGTPCTAGQSCSEGQCAYPAPSDALVIARSKDEISAALTRIGVDAVTAFSDGESGGFVEAYDAQDWDLVIFDFPGASPSAEVKARVIARAGQGKMIFNFWNLDAEADLMAAFGVSCASFDAPPELAPFVGAPVNLFAFRETFPAPLLRTNDAWGDNGDVLTLLEGGQVLVSRDGVSSDAIIVQTNGGLTIVNGFLPSNFSAADMNLLQVPGADPDADDDGVEDITELFVNEITWLYQ